jgi:hypothetical protein
MAEIIRSNLSFIERPVVEPKAAGEFANFWL